MSSLLLVAAGAAPTSSTRHSRTAALPRSAPLALVMGPSEVATAAAILGAVATGTRPTLAQRADLCRSLHATSRALAAHAPRSGCYQLVLFKPQSDTHVFPATWHNVVQYACARFPSIRAAAMALLPGLAAADFADLQQQWQQGHSLSASTTFAAAVRPVASLHGMWRLCG